MTTDEHMLIKYAWNGLCVFAALLYLGAGFVRAAVIAMFVLISSILGVGRRSLLRCGLALAILALGVWLGFPHPQQWPSLAKSALHEFDKTRSSL